MPPVPLGNRTKMESTAALLPKQGSRAMGFGTDYGKKRKKKPPQVLHITSLPNPGEHTLFSKPRITEALLLLFAVTCLCQQHAQQPEKNISIPCRDTHTDLQAQIGSPPLPPLPPLPKSPTVYNFMTMPPVCSAGCDWISSGGTGSGDLCQRCWRCTPAATGSLTHLTF